MADRRVTRLPGRAATGRRPAAHAARWPARRQRPPSASRKRGRSKARIVLVVLPVIGLLACLSVAGAAVVRRGAPDEHAAKQARVSSLHDLRLVNYYPRRAAWQYMWSRWDATTLDQDFAAIRKDGFNAVRVTVFPDTFGYPQPLPSMMDRLDQTLAAAGTNGLAVQLSLFDQFQRWSDVVGSRRWVSAVLGPHRNDLRIAFVDVHNEIDPASPAQRGWLSQVLPQVFESAGTIPVAVSVRGTDAGRLGVLRSTLRDPTPDLYVLHYFGPEGLAFRTMQIAARSVAPTPLLVGEVGASTSQGRQLVSGLPPGRDALEAYQAYYYRAVEWAAASLGLPFAAPWAYWDFAASAAPGGVSPVEQGYGLRRLDGSPKPAMRTITSVLRTGAIDLDINNGFESTVGEPPVPAVWRRWRAGEADFGWDEGVRHGGRSSARISRSSGDHSGVPALYLTPVDGWVSEGDRCRASAWARGAGLTGRTKLAVVWFDASGRYIGQVESAPLATGTTPWRLLTVDAVSPRGAAYAQIHLKSGGNSGTAWFDDVGWSRS